MAGSRRLDPATVAALLRRRWNGAHRRWLDEAGIWPLTIVLHPPTEREAARDPAGARHWIEAWVAVADPGRPGELVWIDRQWTGLGRQRLPERLVLAEPGDVAAWVGEQGRWALARERAAAIRMVLAPLPGSEQGATGPGGPASGAASADATPATSGGPAAAPPVHHGVDPDFDPGVDAAAAGSALRLGRHFDWLADAPDVEFERLVAVLRWLIAHPDSGLYIRQLPIPGIDTKWIGANRGRLVDLLAQHQQREAEQADIRDADLHRLAGLRRELDVMRLRILDPALRATIGGLGDITAPIEQIAELPLAPECVFIVENLQTGLAFDDLPGAVCFMARGYAVDAFGAIPWLRGCPCHYWGDLDTHGFAILSRLRHYLPDVRSLLMDADTLHCHRDLWQHEGKPAAGPLERLTDQERAVFDGLSTDRWGERVRLEQERIDWRYAWQAIVARRAETLRPS
jgi:hypothetical protein